MYKIKEFATLFGISKDTLMFYEEKGLFKPAYIDPKNNYRYYDLSQVKDISLILQLKHMGFTLSEIKENLVNSFNFDQKISKVKQQISSLKRILHVLEMQKNNSHDYRVYFKKVKSGILLYKKNFTIVHRSELNDEFPKFVNELIEKKIKVSQPFRYYAQTTLKNEGTIDAALITSILPNQHIKLEPGYTIEETEERNYICTIHYGSKDLLGNAAQFLINFCKENNIRIIDNVAQKYLQVNSNPNEDITELYLRIDDNYVHSVPLNK